MANADRTIPALVMGALVLSAAATVTGPSRTESLQAALEALAGNDAPRAETLAAPLVGDDRQPCPRAWLVLAAARQRQGRYDQALAAYQAFLARSQVPRERAYALQEIRRCRAAAPAGQPRPMSGQLSAEQLRQLAAVTPQHVIESSEHFVVRAHNGDLARLVVRQAEDALRRICRVILPGIDYPHSVEVYVWPTLAEYARNATTRPEWSGGAFRFAPGQDGAWVRRIDLTQLDKQGRFDTDILDRVLPHEMCHLVLAEFLGDAPSPLALSEGLAMMAETTVDNSRVLLAGMALGGEGKIPVPELLAMERCDPRSAAVFYAEAFSLISYIHSRVTPRQFLEMLTHVKDGCPLEEALQRALYVPCNPDFLARLTRAWENDALQHSQILKALDQTAEAD